MGKKEALRHYFGFDAFRPGQEGVVDAIIAGEDALVIMPTGGGKSLCYQLPALLHEGVTVVVSPLIALMKDQVDALQALDIQATLINSSLGSAEQGRRLNQVAEGAFKLVYVAPERFRDGRFTEALQRVKIALFAVDEAHCVSMWGHDFRPDYLRVGEAIERLGRPPVAAFTATATPDVRLDIEKNLRLRAPKIFVTGFDRPNLELRVRHVSKNAQRYARLGQICETHKTGIIYCATRKSVEKVAERLKEWDVAHVAYHGGMDDATRTEAQEAFLSRRADVAVATNAFGMGIDRANIRFVVHYELPGSVEAYYQEAGRAGRDGLPAICELLFNYADKRTQEFFIEGSNPGKPLIVDVYALLRRLADSAHEVRLSINDLTEAMGPRTNGMAVGTALILLGRQGYVDRFDITGSRVKGTRLLRPELALSDLQIDTDKLEEKRTRDMTRLDGVIQYAYSEECRQGWIMRYFGECDVDDCDHCDSCGINKDRSQGGTSGALRECTAEENLLLRKTLSGVARMSQRSVDGEWIPRYGKNRIIEMLTGSERPEMNTLGLDQLSTYGILKGQSRVYLKKLLSEISRAGLLLSSGDQYPVVTLTPLGEAVMKGSSSVPLAWTQIEDLAKKSGQATGNESEGDFDPVLFEALQEKCYELADSRNINAWEIFPAATLRNLATVKPLTIEEALQVSGIKKFKARRVLPPFLPIIAAHVAGQ